MADEDFALSVGLMADIDELEDQIEDGDFTADVDMQGGGAAGGGGGGVGLGGRVGRSGLITGGAGLAAGGLIAGLLAGILGQLEPINTLVSFIARQFELFLTPVLTSLAPILNELSNFIARAVAFLRDPLSPGADAVFEPAGRLTAQRDNPFANAVTEGLSNAALSVLAPGFAAVSPGIGFLLESSPEAQKEKLGGFLAGILQNDFF